MCSCSEFETILAIITCMTCADGWLLSLRKVFIAGREHVYFIVGVRFASDYEVRHR